MPLESAIAIAVRSTRSLLSGSRGWDPGSARVTTASAFLAHLIVQGKPGPGPPARLTISRCKVTLQRKTPYGVRKGEDEGLCPAVIWPTRPLGPNGPGYSRARGRRGAGPG